MMKRLIVVVGVAAIALSASACHKNKAAQTSAANTSTKSATSTEAAVPSGEARDATGDKTKSVKH